MYIPTVDTTKVNYMESLIYAIVRALATDGVTIQDIHDACMGKKWSEEDIFLAIKAAQNLYAAIKQQEKELDEARNKRPPPFGRKNP